MFRKVAKVLFRRLGAETKESEVRQIADLLEKSSGPVLWAGVQLPSGGWGVKFQWPNGATETTGRLYGGPFHLGDYVEMNMSASAIVDALGWEWDWLSHFLTLSDLESLGILVEVSPRDLD